MSNHYAQEVRVITVKVSRKGPVGSYNVFEFYLKNGMKIGEISEIQLKQRKLYK